MNHDIIVLREVVTKVTRMLSGKKGLRVTQEGANAFVQTDARTLEPIRVNIPNIPDNATEDFILAIQGFIDHEIGHVLDTDWTVVRESNLKGPTWNSWRNIFEDPRVEKCQQKRFPGSAYNLNRLHTFFLEKITKPALDVCKTPADEFGVLGVPMVRAWAGQKVFQDFMNDYWDHPLIKAVMDRMPQEALDRVPLMKSTQDAWELAQILHNIVYPPAPPAPPPPQESDDQEQGEGQGKSDDKSDEKQDGKGSNQNKPEDDEDQGSGGDSDDEKESEGSSGKGEQNEEDEGDDADEQDSSGSAGEGDEADDDTDDKNEGSAGDGSDREEGDDEADAGEKGADGDSEDQGDGAADERDSEAGQSGSEREDDDTDETENGRGGSQDDDQEADEADGEEHSQNKGSAGDDADDAPEDAGDEADEESGGSGSESSDGSNDDEGDQKDEAEGDDEEGGLGGSEKGDEQEGEGDKSDDRDGDLEQGSGTDGEGEENEDDRQGQGEQEEEGGDRHMDTTPSPFAHEHIEVTEFDNAIANRITDEASRNARGADYVVYSRDYDRIETLQLPKDVPDEWVEFIEDKTRMMVGPMQKEIERMMAARSMVQRVPGYRSGRLHAGNLHRLMVNDDRVFRRTHVNNSKDTVVYLKIDNSGSMQGSKMTTAMLAGYALSQTLERVGIKHQVSGFTTLGLKMGHYMGHFSKKGWQLADWDEVQKEQKRLGRLFSRVEALYMPIYKTFDERVTPEVRKRFAVAAQNKVDMGANVDGESVEFALHQILKRKEARKVILVLSDGRPATGPGVDREVYSHVHKVVEDAGKANVEIIGIGIQDASVRTFYPKNMVLNNVEELPGVVMGELKRILTAA
jgi:cobalamin biosynthesis protein CobT